jgi:PAS domain S-box-containing protein
MMKAIPLFDRFGFLLAGCGIGVALAQLTGAPISSFAVVAVVLGIAMVVGSRWTGFDRAKREGRKAEQALRIIESMPALAWFTDANGKFLYMSRNPSVFTGLPKEDLVPTEGDEFGLRNVVHPDDLDRVYAAWRHSLQTGQDYNNEHRMRRADGTYRWFRSFGSPTRDDDSHTAGWYGTTIEIDELKNAEAALRENERSLQQLIDTVPVMIWCLSSQGNPVYFNKRLIEYTGVALEQLNSIDAVVKNVIHLDDAIAVKGAVETAVKTSEAFSLKHRLRRSDGVYRWVDARAEPMRNAEGNIVHWYGVCFDIDAQMRAEEALRLSERSLQQLVDALPVHIWSWTPAGKLAYVNKRSLEELGLSKANFEDSTRVAQELVHPEDAPEVLRISARCLETGDAFMMRYRRRWKDGNYRWLEGRCEPLRDRDGTIMHWYQVSIDIDDQVRAEEALRNSLQQLRQLVDAVPTQIWSLMPNSEPAYMNKTMLDYMGMKLEDYDLTKGLPNVLQTIHPDDQPSVLAGIQHSLSTGDPFQLQWRNRRWDGVYRWTNGCVTPLRDENGSIIQWYGVNVDIDDEMRAHEALRNTTRQLQQMIDAVPINILSFDPSGKLTYASQRYTDQVGSPPVQVENFEALARHLAHPEDLPAMLQRALDGFATGTPFVNRFRRRDKDGHYPWIEARAQPLRDASGTIVQWYIISIDIESEVRTQEELRERERFLWQLVETLPAMIDCASPNGEPIYRSQRLRQFLGYELEALDGTGKTRLNGTLDAGVHPDDVAGVKEGYAHCLATGEPYARRHRLRRFDGDYRWVETRAEAMRDDEGAIVQWNVICLDVDAEVRAQEALRFAQERLARASQAASLAELSASIAHEVNQPLAAVVANSHACQRWLTADPPNIERAHKTVERIIRDANAAADVVSRVRALFKQSLDSRVSTTFGGMIAEMRELMAEEAIRRSVRMDIEVDSSLPPVAVDRVQLQQVLINLVRNGMEAMDALVSDKVLRVRVRRVAEVIRAEISDHGSGFEDPDRIFDAFFTTKAHGMGMGLAICRSIIESHGGKLWAERNDAPGSTFIFTLPIETKEAV